MKDSIFDEREELMVSPLGGIPQLRKAHFLKPIVSSIEGPNLKPPSLPFSSESEWPLKVSFNGCRHQQNKWKKWVETMESVHHSVWKAAGIYDAIMGSLYKVHVDKDLIFGLVERWCCDTNTFVFPWGEATVTLEDIMILGGFSVLGGPVLFALQSPELVETEQNLEKVRRDLVRLKADNHNGWLNFFMDSGRDFEHEAFLALWLSRFVFPGNEYDKVGRHVFPIAVNLARGTRLALSPAVLASIYRDLSLLKQTMIMASSNEPSSNGEDGDGFNILEFSLWAPLFFVQVWAWERLVTLRPEQVGNYNMVSGVRIGRWHNVKQSGVVNVRTTIDSSAETFQWRPYTLAVEGWLIPKFYKENEEWTIVEGQNVDQELESFVRFLRVSELVGLDCQEHYRPNRVALQFGYDQDFPKWIPRSSSSPELAWYNYSRPIDSDFRLYYPSRLFEPDVTIQYLKWWRRDILYLAYAFKGLSHGRRSKRRLKRISSLYDSPVFAPKLKQVKVEIPWDVCDVPPDPPTECQLKHVENYPDVPPGFPPRCCGENDKRDLSMVCQTVACDIVPRGFVVKHNAGESVHTSTDAHDSNESSSVVLPKCNGENDKENLSMGVCQTVACDVVPPGSAEKQTDCEQAILFPGDAFKGLYGGRMTKRKLKRISNFHDSSVFAPKLKLVKVEKPWDVCDVLPDLPTECQLKQVGDYPDVPPLFPPKWYGENDKKNLSTGFSQKMACDVVPLGLMEKHSEGESVYTSTDAHDNNESSSVVPPKRIGENDKENLSMGGCQTVACDIVLPVLMEKHNAGKSAYTSIDAHDSNETSSVVPSKCVVEYDTVNLSMGICQTVACDFVPPGSKENHIDSEHSRNESKSSTARNLVINEQKRWERTSCDDLIKVMEARLSRLERQVASRKRC